MTDTSTANQRPLPASPSEVLLGEIDAFLKEEGISESYFGKAACGNSELVARLRSGGECRYRTAEKVRLFIRQRAKARAEREAVEGEAQHAN